MPRVDGDDDEALLGAETPPDVVGHADVITSRHDGMTSDDDEALLGAATPPDDGAMVAPPSASRCSRLRHDVTIEPVIFLYFVGYVTYLPTLQQYVMHRVAQDLAGFDNITLPANCSPEAPDVTNMAAQVKATSSDFLMLVNMVALVPSVVVTLFMGHYSDHAGRRIAILLPIAGCLARSVVALIVVYYEWNMYVLLAGALVDAATGSVMSVVMACMAYISDITTSAHRSRRILFVEVAVGMGIAVATISGGYTIRYAGFSPAFLLSVAALSATFLLTLIYLPESVLVTDPGHSFFTTRHLKLTWTLFRVETSPPRRAKLLTIFAMLALDFIWELGLNDPITLTLVGYPLCFTSVAFGWHGVQHADGGGCHTMAGGAGARVRHGHQAHLAALPRSAHQDRRPRRARHPVRGGGRAAADLRCAGLRGLQLDLRPNCAPLWWLRVPRSRATSCGGARLRGVPAAATVA